MLGNYFTLLKVSRSIHEHCAGRNISEVYSQQKQQLSIVVDSEPARTIIVSCDPSRNYLFLQEGNYRARRNSLDLFPASLGKKIHGVTCAPEDRVITISLGNDLAFECAMFGSRANVALWKEGQTDRRTLIEVFLKSKEPYVGRPPDRRTLEALTSKEVFVDALRSAGAEAILKALKRMLPNFGSTLAAELIHRAGVDPSQEASAISERDGGKVFAEMSSMLSELTSTKPELPVRIYYRDHSPVCLSLIPLHSIEAAEVETYADISEAIRRYVGAVHSASTLGDEKQKVSAWLQKEEIKAAHTRSKLAEELDTSDRSALYELQGKLIMANIHLLRKGVKSARLENQYSADASEPSMTVLLNPALSPSANAESYFQKAKKARVAAKETEERLRGMDHRLALLRSLAADLAEISSREGLEEFMRTNHGELKELGFVTEKEKENLPPFRLFSVEGGFQVLAGKSSENNDMLTMKYAKPNDLWFHCRGSSGSHVVLRISSAPGEPSKSAIHQAASIAAYYSKMKNASAVPVVMTEKKYVHKPKGAPAGTVTLDREKVIFVEPRLPQPERGA